jgi:beta-glucosidase
VDGLRERGIAPMVTLFHWDLPQPLQDAGGWGNRDSAKWFADYADVVFRALGDAVPVWLTINEPKTIVGVGHTYGVHAPGHTDADAATVVLHHLNLAHGLAVQAYRATGARQRIGPALNLSPVLPFAEGAGDDPALARADVQENRLYLDPVLKGRYPDGGFPAGAAVHRAIRDGDLAVISSPVDILAVQYYGPITVDGTGQPRNRFPTSQASWQQIYPQGMYDLLVRIKRDYGDIPLTITENGAPFPDVLDGDEVRDPRRVEFLREHLGAARRAIAAGVRLESYHLWSLLDNFEWAEGYDQRWGIVYVDYPTQRRVLKDSAKWYRDVIARNGLP